MRDFVDRNEQKEQEEDRVHINVSLSKEDKLKLKVYALRKGMTVSKVIHEFIESLDDDVSRFIHE